MVSHFEDGDKLQIMKDRFTIKPNDLQLCKQLIATIANELKARPADQQQQQEPGSKPAPAPQPNEVNSTKPAPVHNKLPQRPNSKGVQPPAAPTSSQPPFPFGAQSPDGKPQYVGPPPLTQEKLQLPSTKKRKTGASTSSPAGNSQTASPQTTKATSPEMKKQEPKAAPKPTFPCTVPDCEMGTPAFDSEASRSKHIEEFHVLPFRNPEQFLEQAIAEGFEVINPAGSDDSTPMMKQESAAGGPAPTQGAKSDDNKVAGSHKPSDNGQTGINPQDLTSVLHNAFSMPMGNGTIDPASLFAPSTSLFDPTCGGVIAEPGLLYRSTTPNEDTPESSKDSGASEPNSDINESSALDIEMNFVDSAMLMDLNFGGDADGQGFDAFTDDLLVDLDGSKPFQPPERLDMSLYEFDYS